MANEIVKFNNQFNNVALKGFTSQELNLLITIASKLKEKKGEKLSSYVWDNEISFVRLNRGFKIGNQPINYRSIIGVKHSETDTKLSKRNADYKFYIGQRLSAFFSNVGAEHMVNWRYRLME